MGKRAKVINLRRSLAPYIEEHRAANPYLESLAWQVKSIIEQLHQRQISATSALEQLQQTADKAVMAQEERRASPLDNMAFSQHMTLRANLFPERQPAVDVDQVENDVAFYLRGNDGWRHSKPLEPQVRLELLRRMLEVLPQPVNSGGAKRIVDDLLTMQAITA